MKLPLGCKQFIVARYARANQPSECVAFLVVEPGQSVPGMTYVQSFDADKQAIDYADLKNREYVLDQQAKGKLAIESSQDLPPR